MGCSTVQKAILIVTESSCQVTSRSIPYLKEKYKIDVKGGERESAVNVNLTLSFNKQINFPTTPYGLLICY